MLYSNTAGSYNAANGGSALYSNTTGNNNIAIGDSAGFKSLGSGNIYLGKRAGYYETGSNKLYIGNDSAKTILYGNMATGQVLLGNKQPNGYVFKGTRTLNVLGGIIADSVRVALSSAWADHVFEKDYPLQSLEELNNFIKTHKHLPNIPSAKEVAANGIELGSMNAKLLEKIEELTLYILQQQKDNELMKQEIAEIKKRIGN